MASGGILYMVKCKINIVFFIESLVLWLPSHIYFSNMMGSKPLSKTCLNTR